MIELDLLRPRGDFDAADDWRRAAAGPAGSSGPLLVAHDWADAARRDPLTLSQVLDAFRRPPLEQVRFDLDLKIAGREDEIVAALDRRDLLGRAMVSTMEPASLAYLREAAPALDRGWTLPKARRDWASSRLLRPAYLAGAAALRARLPRMIREQGPKLGVWAVWVYHPLITARLVEAAHGAGIAVIAWTVDDPARIAALTALGIDGICSNDPRLLWAAAQRGIGSHIEALSTATAGDPPIPAWPSVRGDPIDDGRGIIHQMAPRDADHPVATCLQLGVTFAGRARTRPGRRGTGSRRTRRPGAEPSTAGRPRTRRAIGSSPGWGSRFDATAPEAVSPPANGSGWDAFHARAGRGASALRVDRDCGRPDRRAPRPQRGGDARHARPRPRARWG